MRDNRIDLPCSYYDFTGGIDVFKGCKKLVPNNIPPVDQMFQSTRPRGARQVERDHYRVSVNNLQKEISALRKQLDESKNAGFWGRACARLSIKNEKLESELSDLRESLKGAKIIADVAGAEIKNLRGRMERANSKLCGFINDNDRILSVAIQTMKDTRAILSGNEKGE